MYRPHRNPILLLAIILISNSSLSGCIRSINCNPEECEVGYTIPFVDPEENPPQPVGEPKLRPSFPPPEDKYKPSIPPGTFPRPIFPFPTTDYQPKDATEQAIYQASLSAVAKKKNRDGVEVSFAVLDQVSKEAAKQKRLELQTAGVAVPTIGTTVLLARAAVVHSSDAPTEKQAPP